MDEPVHIGNILNNLNLTGNNPQIPTERKSTMQDVRSMLSKPRRAELITALEPYLDSQMDLFSHSDLDPMFERLSIALISEEPLYSTWSHHKGKKKRNINNPNKDLDFFIDKCLMNFIKSQPAHKNCHGWEQGWSVQSSLEEHLPVESVLSFDLKDAFPRTNFRRVAKFYYNSLPDTMEEKDRRDSAAALAILTTVKEDYRSKRRGLPQGSPLSPIIFNRTLLPWDKKLTEECGERGYTYTRWGDDLIVGSSEKKSPKEMIGAVDLVSRKLAVAEDKVYFQQAERGNIYLLGCKIFNGKTVVRKKEDKDGVCLYEDGTQEPTKKLPSLSMQSFSKYLDFEPWYDAD